MYRTGAWSCPRCSSRLETMLTGFDTGFSMGKPDRTEPDAGPCPHCSQPLVSLFVDRANLWVNICNTHGTWFDAREMHSLARALKNRKKPVAVSGNEWKPDPDVPPADFIDLLSILFR